MPPRRAVSAGAIALAMLQCLAVPAFAQVAFSAAAESDDRVRGVSLSDGRPILSLSVAYDSPDGPYAGATVLGIDTRNSGLQTLGYVAYAGYAARLNASTSWEVGVTNNQISVYLDRKYLNNYTEIYAGFTEKNVSVHIYYSPEYLYEKDGAIYIEADGAVRPAEHWRLFGHMGLLSPMNAADPSGDERTVFDVRAGVAREFTHADLHLALTTTSPAPMFPPGRGQQRTALVFGAAYFF
jgi:uncharacterized protein (TIGR02001 family)